MDAGQSLNIKPFGICAMDSLRFREILPTDHLVNFQFEYSALESGLDRFVALQKEDFIGRGLD